MPAPSRARARSCGRHRPWSRNPVISAMGVAPRVSACSSDSMHDAHRRLRRRQSRLRRTSKGSDAWVGSSALESAPRLVKPAMQMGDDRLLGTADKRGIGIAMADGANSLADVVRASRTGGGHVDARPVNAIADGEVDRRRCCRSWWGRTAGSRAWGPCRASVSKPFLQLVDAADARTERSMATRVESTSLHGRCPPGPWPRQRRPWRTGRSARSGAPPSWTARARFGSKPRTSPAAMHLDTLQMCRNVRNGVDAAALAHHGIPQRVHADAGRRDRAHARDDHALRAVRAAQVADVLDCRDS